MAISRSGGLTAVHVWLIVFVVLWLASTVGLVVMYTNQQKITEDADRAQKTAEALASGGDLSDPLVADVRQYAQGQSPSQRLVPAMAAEIHALAELITGDATHGRREAEGRLEAMLDAIRTAKIVPSPDEIKKSSGAERAIKSLYVWYLGERNQRETAQQQLAEAVTALEQAQSTVKKLESTFGDSLASMKKQVDELQSSKNEYEASKQAEIDDFGAKLAAGQEALGQARKDTMSLQTQYTKVVKSRDDVIARQLEKISEVQGPPPDRAAEDSIAREPVGRVLRALPGDSLVYIDLGETDGVSLGMRFAVYSSDRRVPADGRGKANLEVVEVSPNTAVCRVATSPAPDDPILEQDYVQNVILARTQHRKQRFVIIGEFDIDYDERPDLKGADKIRSYIERFGGEVVNAVDANTDYLVVGTEPDAKGDAPPPEVDPAAGPRDRQAVRAGQSHQDALRQAMLLNVPRLRQEVFLNFVGLVPGRDVANRLLN